MLVMSPSLVGQLTFKAPRTELPPLRAGQPVLLPLAALSMGEVQSCVYGDCRGLREECVAVCFIFTPSCSFPCEGCPPSTAF